MMETRSDLGCMLGKWNEECYEMPGCDTGLRVSSKREGVVATLTAHGVLVSVVYRLGPN